MGVDGSGKWRDVLRGERWICGAADTCDSFAALLCRSRLSLRSVRRGQEPVPRNGRNADILIAGTLETPTMDRMGRMDAMDRMGRMDTMDSMGRIDTMDRMGRIEGLIELIGLIGWIEMVIHCEIRRNQYCNQYVPGGLSV